MNQQQIIQLTQNEKIEIDVKEPKLNILQLVMTINTKEPFSDPNAIQADFITQKSDTIMAVKISRLLAFFSLRGQEIKQRDSYEESNNQIMTCFRLIDSNNVILGYYDGKIVQKQIKPPVVVREFNQNGLSKMVQKKPIKIHIFQKYICILFMEGVLSINQLEFKNPKFEIDYDRFIQLSFSQHKQLVNPKILKKFNMDNGFHYNFLNHGEFTNFQMTQTQSNPEYIFRFANITLNNMEILPFSPLEHLNQSELRMENGLCLALSGIDGYFMLMDAKNNKALFSFKTEIGGITTFSFNPNFSTVCLGTQDDSVYIINFHQQISWIKLIGHSSFISGCVFNSLTATEFRIICGSYDGTISITDIDLNEFIQEQGLFIKAIEKEQTVQIKNRIYVNQDGVSGMMEFQNYIVCMNFDGSIKILMLQ